jgi:asparagine synthetase B (glutamine-hydrolysing)
MCGIYACIKTGGHDDKKTVCAWKLMNHRGPDMHGVYDIYENQFNKTTTLLHTRLKINGDDNPQPIVYKKYHLIVNGEIFNWKELEKELDINVKSQIVK